MEMLWLDLPQLQNSLNVYIGIGIAIIIISMLVLILFFISMRFVIFGVEVGSVPLVLSRPSIRLLTTSASVFLYERSKRQDFTGCWKCLKCLSTSVMSIENIHKHDTIYWEYEEWDRERERGWMLDSFIHSVCLIHSFIGLTFRRKRACYMGALIASWLVSIQSAQKNGREH